MPIKQTALFRGNARTPQAHPHRFGDLQVIDFIHTFTEDVNTADVLELCILPAFCKIHQLILNTENIAATNLTVGVMTGTPGSLDPARTIATAVLSAVPAGTEVAAARVALGAAGVQPNSEHRSIGLVPSANITLAANKRLHFFMSYSG